ncbi:MAG: hypothetical protein HY342_04625 [Candidatus Lambdaproteobacteria bacterium]|nr:hypothetical protein [Candidatus Lambdaproteobacteria bacterium]
MASAHDPTPDAAQPAAEELVRGRDYELDALGRWVFTRGHLLRRGYCCFLGCRHCPHGQAGRTQAQAQADLAQRLRRLGERLRAEGLPPLRLGYRNGVLHVSPAADAAPNVPAPPGPAEGQPGPLADRAVLQARLLALAMTELIVRDVR